MVHKLDIDSTYHPVKQKKWRFVLERQKAIIKEADKLVKAGFIKEVIYLDWLVNLVLIKKVNGTSQMCIDFTNLNKACLKDSYPLPRIDQLVDATSNYKLFIFLDVFSGYNQIRMVLDDKEKITFIIDHGLYCYKLMPLGLKIAGATYQHLVNKIFKD